MNGLTSKTLSDRFNKPLEFHSIETHFAKNNNLCLPHPRTNYMKKGFSYTGVNCWNKLPLEVKKSKNLYSFKIACCNFIHKSMYIIVNYVYFILCQIS